MRARGWGMAGACALVVAIWVASAAVASADCLLGCPAGSGSAPAMAAPVLSTPTVSGLTKSSVTLTATLNTGGLATTYYFQVESSRSPTPIESPQGNASAAASPQTITTQTQLIPGTTYSAFVLAYNSDGTVSGPRVSFTTPPDPALPVSLTAAKTVVSIGTADPLTVHLAGGAAPVDQTLQQAFAPFHDYSNAPSGDTVYEGASPLFDVHPVRNTSYRVLLDGRPSGSVPTAPGRRPSMSRPVLVVVEPLVSLNTVQDPADPADAISTLTAVVHPLPRGYVGERAYFYLGSSAGGPFRLSAAPRFRVVHEGSPGTAVLRATDTFRVTSPSVYVDTCLQHELLSDMGRRFVNRRCGEPTVP